MTVVNGENGNPTSEFNLENAKLLVDTIYKDYDKKTISLRTRDFHISTLCSIAEGQLSSEDFEELNSYIGAENLERSEAAHQSRRDTDEEPGISTEINDDTGNDVTQENSEQENADNQGNNSSLKEKMSGVIDTTKETITDKIAVAKDFVTNFITPSEVSQFLKKAAQSYDSEAALDVKTRIQNRIGEFDTIRELSDVCIEMIYNLHPLTITKLSENKSITPDKVEIDLTKYINTCYDNLAEIAAEFGFQMVKIENKDEEASGNQTSNYSYIRPSGGSGGSSGSRGGSSSGGPSINEIVIDGGGAAIALAGAIVGVVKFKEIVTMYENIGSGTGVQASLTGNYGLIGIVKDSGKNYYKILDKDTNKVYYIEINDKVEIQTDLNKLLEVNDKAMMLTTTEIGSDNFSKFADTNTLYFIQNEVQKDNINFMNVIDSDDGKDYFIPLSDSVNVVSLDSVIKPNEGTIK